MTELSAFFTKYPKIALAFSGGTDSAYLLYAAKKSGAEVHAYYVKSAFQPHFELEDAMRFAHHLDADITMIEVDVLSNNVITANPRDRCYHCKKLIFSAIAEQASADGYKILIDGTNADDCAYERPGMRALTELSVLSPLSQCGLKKEKIRNLSKDAGLFTWNKPAYACLATRIPAGEVITKEKLEYIEHAEDYLFSLGFSDFRVRVTQKNAKIQILSRQFDMLINKRKNIIRELKKYYSSVTLDMEARDEQ